MPTVPLTDAEIDQVRDLLGKLANGFCLVPCPTVAGQMLAATTDQSQAKIWALVDPPSTANNQPLQYGTGDPAPYWANQQLGSKGKT